MKQSNRWAARILGLALSLSMVSATAFAAPWYLEDGSIFVEATEQGQSVSQDRADGIYTENSWETADAANPVITNRDPGTAANNNITVATQGSAQAQITIKDVNIQTGNAGYSEPAPIEAADANVTIHVEGSNKVSNEASFGGGAAIHTGGSGNLEITSDTAGSLDADAVFDAAIGSDRAQQDGDLNGSIKISGNVNVDAHVVNGSAIGAGYDGKVGPDGKISITDTAKVTATSENGVAMGSMGQCQGTIQILNQSQVDTPHPAPNEYRHHNMIGGGADPFHSEVSPHIDGPSFVISSGSTINGQSVKAPADLDDEKTGGVLSGTITYETKDGIPNATVVDSSWTGEKPAPNPGSNPDADKDPAVPGAESFQEPRRENSADTPFWITSEGKHVAYGKDRSGDVLTLTVSCSNAEFSCTAVGYRVLLNTGIHTVRFVTPDCTVSIDVTAIAESDLSVTAQLQLICRGETNTFTADGQDAAEYLKK